VDVNEAHTKSFWRLLRTGGGGLRAKDYSPTWGGTLKRDLGVQKKDIKAERTPRAEPTRKRKCHDKSVTSAEGKQTGE